MRNIEDISELQEINGKAAQQWVRKQNRITQKRLDKTATFRKLYKDCQEAINKNTAIDDILIGENGLYQRIFTDKKHPKGLLQEIEKESYLSKNPEWTTLLDIDLFAKEENKAWEFLNSHDETFNRKVYSLLSFSEAGSDAFIAREFNVKTKKFVANGFSLPKAQSDITWYTSKSLLVATEHGENSLTCANYPRTIKLLNREQPLQQAETVFEIDTSHMMATSLVWHNNKKRYLFFIDHIDFNHSLFYLVSEKNLKEYHALPIPTDAELIDIYQNTALIKLNTDWQIDEKTLFKQNALIGLDLKRFRRNPQLQPNELNIQLWYQANDHSKIETVFCNQYTAYIFVVNNLQMQIFQTIHSSKSIRLREIPIPLDYSYACPLFIDNDGEMIFNFETFTHPKTIYAYNPDDASLKILQQASPYFDPKYYFVRRLEAISKDGTKVPYHIVSKRGLKQDGLNPTILRGYGGFAHYLNSTYLQSKATILLEQGMIYVHAHIRGGGEFSQQWYKMGSCEYKQNSFDDFIAVAEDLIYLKITSPNYLGIRGESNGGLLVGACITQRPELFGAVFCDVALLDMLHYHKLFIGYGWIAEYGNPDNPTMHQILEKYSPLHNISVEKKYPEIFIQTSKTDDRVHPYHSRAMAFQLQQAKKPVFYFEKKDGGHAGVSFEECIRIYTYWHLQLLIPAQRERKRQREEAGENTAGFFQGHERHASHRRLAREHTNAAKMGS